MRDVEYPVDLLKKPFTYLCCYSSNVNQLRKEVSKLEIEINTVNEMIENAKVESGDIRIPANVQAWRVKVESIQIDSDQIFNEAEQIQKNCLSKRIPFLHWSLSRKAQKTVESAVQSGNPRFEQVAYPTNTADLQPIPTTSEILLKSRLSLEEEIINALKQSDAYLIGIHGMGGVGKTTMVENIERKLAKKTQDSSKMFERIVKAVVSQEPDFLKIQKEVAEGLGLKLEDENLSNRAKRLHTSLVNTRSILIIFDDVWDRLDLEHIGIPSQSTHVGCKLILTSRNRKALTSTTENAKIFPLNVLEDDEAWVLFRNNAGNSIDSPELHHIAKQVCRECKGLPLAIEVVGRALNGESEACWENSLVGLQQVMPQNIPKVLEHVYKPLLLSFDNLESEYRYLLLLCCLFEEDSWISLEELVIYGWGLGMFEDMECLREVRNKVKSIVGHLISRSLLLDSIDNWGNLNVKMHDVVRDVGIHMKKHEFLISHGRKEWPKIIKEGSYSNYACISLTSSEEIASFPECKECLRLQLLRVAYNGSGTLKLPNNLFTSTGMSRDLRVLEIWKLDSLPSSIHMLKNLRTLYLFGSRLERVSVIGELMNLETLRLRRCEFDMLPKKIGALKNLKKLDVTDCWELKKIEYGVVSGLVRLEEFTIIGSPLEWGAEEEEGQGIKDKSSLAELNSLNHLTTLCIEILNSNAIPKEMPLWVHNVKKYSILIPVHYSLDLTGFQRIIHLGDDIALLGDWFYDEMARNAEYLALCGSSCTNVVTRLISSGYQSTRVLNLKWCNNVKYLSHALFERRQNGPIFPVLKTLDIEDSDSLEEICNGAPPAGSFKELERICFKNLKKLTFPWTFSCEKFYLSVLKIIRIKDCDKLLYIFPVAVCLPQLQELEVSSCPAIQEIFKREEGSVETINKIKLPKLSILRLNNLPSLHDFSKGLDEVEFPELSKLALNFPNHKRNDDHDAQHLYLFDLRVESNSIQPWFSLATIKNINCFSGIKKLRIGFLNNVKSIFSPSVLGGFAKLRELDVKSCFKLENVARETRTNTILFPQLKKLTLTDLPVLLAFCHNMGNFDLPSLERLHIKNCPMMETFCKPFSDVSKSEQVTQSFFTEEVLFPNLSELVLIDIKAARIFGETILIDSFGRLRKLEVRNCERMTNVFSDPNIFTSLKYLYLDSCGELQEVIAEEHKNIKITHFPQLWALELTRLPKMHTFCHIKDDLELSSLKSVTIKDCPKLETFSLGSLHFPDFEEMRGLSDPDLATKIFFHKEKPYHKSHLDNYCFTISATDLSFDTEGFVPSWILMPDLSDCSFFSVAVLYFYKSVRMIKGKLEIGRLIEGVVYEIILIIRHDDGFGKEKSLLSKLILHGEVQQHHNEAQNDIDEIPRGNWIEIIVGEFIREPHRIADLEFSVSLRSGRSFELHIKGIVIRSKGSNE